MDKTIKWLIGVFGVIVLVCVFSSGVLFGQVDNNTIEIAKNTADIKQLTLSVATKGDLQNLQSVLIAIIGNNDKSEKLEKKPEPWAVVTRTDHDCAICGELIEAKTGCLFSPTLITKYTEENVIEWKGWQCPKCSGK